MAKSYHQGKERARATLERFLGQHKDSYFIIGGHAVENHLQLQSLGFRVTRDYDIVIVSEVQDNSFAIDLAKLLESGGYQFGYRNNDQKHIAYRFESPSCEDYPDIIEFFVREGAKITSLDKRFAKLNIVVNQERISAMVLHPDIYDFALRHVEEIHGLMFVDKYALIALKAYAYFENLTLNQQGKVSSEDYKKHARDILYLLGLFTPSEITTIHDLPEILKAPLAKIASVLISPSKRLRDFRLDKEFVVETFRVFVGTQ